MIICSLSRLKRSWINMFQQTRSLFTLAISSINTLAAGFKSISSSAKMPCGIRIAQYSSASLRTVTLLNKTTILRDRNNCYFYTYTQLDREIYKYSWLVFFLLACLAITSASLFECLCIIFEFSNSPVLAALLL